MKLKGLMAAVLLAVMCVPTGILYAANGDLIVNGNLGVGTNSPAAKAEINGALKVDGVVSNNGEIVNGNVSITGAGNGIVFSDGTTQKTAPAATLPNGDLIVNGNLGVGTNTPAAKAEINGDMTVDGNLTVQGNISGNLGAAVASGLTVSGNATINGNLGVGTTTPTQKLDVNGKVKGTGLCIGSNCTTTLHVSGGLYGWCYWDGGVGCITQNVKSPATCTSYGCFCPTGYAKVNIGSSTGPSTYSCYKN